MPLVTASPTPFAPFPVLNHCQFPGAAPKAGLNFIPNGTDCPGTNLLTSQGLAHCMPSGKMPRAELVGSVALAVAPAATLNVDSPIILPNMKGMLFLLAMTLRF